MLDSCADMHCLMPKPVPSAAAADTQCWVNIGPCLSQWDAEGPKKLLRSKSNKECKFKSVHHILQSP